MPIIAAHLLKEGEGDTDIYNGLDCLITAEILENMDGLRSQAEPLYSFERALQGPVLEMMTRGMLVDPGAREKGIRELRARLQIIANFIDDVAEAVMGDVTAPKAKVYNYPKPKRLNPDSTKQLHKFFSGYLGIPNLSRWEQGVEKISMDREVLESIEVYFHARPIVNAIMEYRDTVGQLEVFESEVDNDWRMRTTYQIAGTDTTRFSSSKSITGSGRNLQNIEEGLRHIFIPDPGKRMYGIDLEQTESREVGLLCGLLFDDWKYLDFCESGDLHTSVARMCFLELPWTGDRKLDREIAERNFYRHYSYRDATKKLGHGSNYYGTPPNMASQTKIPVDLVAPFQELYFDTFPAIPRYHQWVAEQIQTTGRLTNVFGVTRDFFDRADSAETLRAAIASLPQSATAQRLNLGLWRLWYHCPDFELLAQLHDAVYFQADEHLDPQTVARRAMQYVELPIILPNGRKFLIPGEAKAGFNWGARKEDTQTHIITNPNGLVKIKL